MKRMSLILLGIAFACGCRYAQVPCMVSVGADNIPAVAIRIPYEYDYHSEIRWFGKSPWNAELYDSDNGCIRPFGSVCAMMPENPISSTVKIQLTTDGYDLIWSGKKKRSYSAKEANIPEAYKLTIEIDNETKKHSFRCEQISLDDAKIGVAGSRQQFVIFTKDGVLIKRLKEFRFSFVQRPIKPLRSRRDNRSVVVTKEDKEVLDYIDKHAYEIKRLL